MDALVKSPESPFDKLRANGGLVEIIDFIPFVVSLSNHRKYFLRDHQYGNVVGNEWLKTKDIRGNVELDYYIVMPNHFHGILVINDCRGVLQYAPTENRKFRSPSQTIGAIVRGFKSAATKRINEIRDNHGCPVWQRNYYEHVIRNDDELNNVRQYIIDNPLKWELDEENPG